MDVEETVKRIVSDLFEIPVGDLDDSTSPETVEKWDSLSHLNMVLALEEEYGIRIDDNDIVEMVDLKKVCSKVREYLGR